MARHESVLADLFEVIVEVKAATHVVTVEVGRISGEVRREVRG